MKKPLKRQTIEIAVAGICAGLMLLFLWLAVIVRFGSISFYIAAAIVLMVPISKKYYWAAGFAYIASSLLAFAIVGDITQVLGFLLYFGPMTFMSCFMEEKKVKLYITYPVKIVFINAVLAILYFASKTLVINLDSIGFSETALGVGGFYAIVAIVGTVILLLIDLLMLIIYKRLKPLLEKVIKEAPKRGELSSKKDNAVFEEFEELESQKGEEIKEDKTGDSVLGKEKKSFEENDNENYEESIEKKIQNSFLSRTVKDKKENDKEKDIAKEKKVENVNLKGKKKNIVNEENKLNVEKVDKKEEK